MCHAHTRNYTQRVRGLGLGLGISICVKKTSFIIYVPYSYYLTCFKVLSGNDRAPSVRVVLLPEAKPNIRISFSRVLLLRATTVRVLQTVS